MDKEKIIYPYNGKLFNNKKQWRIDACYNMDELLKHYTKLKKLMTKKATYCMIPFTWKVSEQANQLIKKRLVV